MTIPIRTQPLRLAVLLALAAIGVSSSALAAPKKKKPVDADAPKAAPADSGSASGSADTPASDTTTPKADKADNADKGEGDKADSAASGTASAPMPKADEFDNTNTREDPNIRYYFVGLHYRGTIIPQFFENLFVDEGGTVYSNSIGIELDMRKQGQSMIPWIQYTDYSMGDTLFHQKGESDIPGNYSVVNSQLKALYLGLDELWSMPIDESHHWDFEFGFGVGIGIVFGSLYNNWVYEDDQNGTLHASTGRSYVKCNSESSGILPPPGFPAGTGTGCMKSDHQNASIAKVGNYSEPNWFNGGSVPVLFPHISFPQFSVRYKPIKQMETRLSVGFSITGFWFGLSANYGLEKPEDSKAVKASSAVIPAGLLY